MPPSFKLKKTREVPFFTLISICTQRRSCVVVGETSFVHVVPLYTVQCNRPSPQIAVWVPWDAEKGTLGSL